MISVFKFGIDVKDSDSCVNRVQRDRYVLKSAIAGSFCLLISNSPAIAQTSLVNLEEITLPTDLIARVVYTEDDIKLSGVTAGTRDELLQQTLAVLPKAATPNLVEGELATAIQPAKTQFGSIFADVIAPTDSAVIDDAQAKQTELALQQELANAERQLVEQAAEQQLALAVAKRERTEQQLALAAAEQERIEQQRIEQVRIEQEQLRQEQIADAEKAQQIAALQNEVLQQQRIADDLIKTQALLDNTSLVTEIQQDILGLQVDGEKAVQALDGALANKPDTDGAEQPELINDAIDTRIAVVDTQTAVEQVDISQSKTAGAAEGDPSQPAPAENAFAVLQQVEVKEVDSMSDQQAAELASVDPAAVDQSKEPQSPVQTIEAQSVVDLVTEEQEEMIDEDLLILGWATAWSDNDVDTYLSYYDSSFVPEQRFASRDDWEAYRRKRLENQNIRIVVSNAEVYRATNEVIEVRFTQRYTSSSYKDRVIKSVLLKRAGDDWKITAERTVEKLNFE